ARRHVAVVTAQLREQRESAPVLRVEGARISRQVLIVGGAVRDVGAHETGERLSERTLADGRLGVRERLAKALDISRDGGELRDQLVRLARQLIGVLQRKEDLCFQAVRAAVPEEAGAISEVPERLRVAPGHVVAGAAWTDAASAVHSHGARQLI